jgi:N-acylneuraminate cytidylyltransferase
MKYIVIICARGGSKGLPDKNIKPIGGVPLVARSILVAKKIKNVSRVIVSTDSLKVAEIAIEYGAEVPFMRPSYLAKDDAAEWKVWQHAISFLEGEGEIFDGLISLPPTSPLRSFLDVEKCIDEFEKGGVDVVITSTVSNKSPYFNMVVADENGYCNLVNPGKKIYRRQDSPLIYDMTTVAYVARPLFVKKYNGLFEGKIKQVQIPIERAVDIDNQLDFDFVEFLYLKKNNEKY